METPIIPDNHEADSGEIENESVKTLPNRGKGLGSWLNKRKLTIFWLLVTLTAFLMGIVSGYQVGITRLPSANPSAVDSPGDQQAHMLAAQVNPSKGYTIPAKYGIAGPKLLEAGAIDYSQFEQIYAQSGKPLTDEQKTILNKGSDQEIVITGQNAYFMLNFFWALGLTNQNSILTQGPMMENGKEQVGNFASTGGWTIGAKAPMELYASAPIVSLTSEQQALLDKVASVVYRPCCDNPTPLTRGRMLKRSILISTW